MKNFSLNIRSLKKIFAYGTRLKATRDWLLLLSITGILLVICTLWNVYIFSELANGKIIGASTTTPATAAPVSVTHAQDIFKQRALEEGNYQSLYHFVDPSLPSS